MPEVFWRVRIRQVVTLSMDERVFVESKNRFGTISGRNIKCMIVRCWKVLVHLVRNLSIFDSTRTSMTEPRFSSLILKKTLVQSEKVCGMSTSVAETITSVMRWAQTEGSLVRKQYSFHGKSEKYFLMSSHRAES